MKQKLSDIYLFISIYSKLYLFVLLFLRIEFVETLVVIFILFIGILIDFNLNSIIDFVTSTYVIMVLSSFTALFSFGLILLAIYLLNISKDFNTDISIESASMVFIVIFIIWIIISYFIFKKIISFLEEKEILGQKIITLTNLHFKIIEAGTVIFGFLSALVAIIITEEYSKTVLTLILVIYTSCLIPFLYFHFNEDKYIKKSI